MNKKPGSRSQETRKLKKFAFPPDFSARTHHSHRSRLQHDQTTPFLRMFFEQFISGKTGNTEKFAVGKVKLLF